MKKITGASDLPPQKHPLEWRMRVVTVVFLMLMMGSAGVARAADPWIFERIYDGDTFMVRVESLPPELRQISVRIRGIDAPELGSRAKCKLEQAMGLRARDRLTQLLRAGPIVYRHLAWDKYGGRVDAQVVVAGIDVGEQLIKERLVRRYDGGKRAGWC